MKSKLASPQISSQVLCFCGKGLAILRIPTLASPTATIPDARYVVSVDKAKNAATAGIREVNMSHAYAGLDGAAFCVMYKSCLLYTSPSPRD